MLHTPQPCFRYFVRGLRIAILDFLRPPTTVGPVRRWIRPLRLGSRIPVFLAVRFGSLAHGRRMHQAVQSIRPMARHRTSQQNHDAECE